MSHTFDSSSSAAALLSISHGIVTGGTYTLHQHAHDNRNVNIQGPKTGFDRLLEAVAPGAFHNSGERFDPPKCHPNTRTGVMTRIIDWILGQDPETRSALIIWLNGAAGAGKSAIAQSIAEKCYAEGYLVGSFFFGRSDPNRNHVWPLFPTIAYQMALAFPQIQEKLSSIVEHDPLIFTRSLSAQFYSLIVEPIQDLARIGSFLKNPVPPRLIIIDGLDECVDRQVQRQILDVILEGIISHNLPLIFLIASRPEHDISNRFSLPDTQKILTRLFLDDSYLPDLDIELFFRDKFRNISETHPFKKSISTPWPTDDVIEALVQKSSGQFIYASVVVKYVESSRHRPDHRLEVIQNLRPAPGDRPFAELDALYTHILSRVDDIETVLRIIAFKILNVLADTKKIECILSLEPGVIEVLFCDLSSIIALSGSSEHGHDQISLEILHASLPDFLLDKSRSYTFYIDLDLERTRISRKCVQFLASEPFTGDSRSAAHATAMSFFKNHGKDSLHSIDLQNDLYSVSIFLWYQGINMETEISVFSPIYLINFSMLGAFLETLYSSGSETSKRLYAHHLQSFHDVLSQHLQVYFSDSHLTLLVALIDFSIYKQGNRPYAFNPEFLLFKVDLALLQMDSKRLCLLSGETIYQFQNWENEARRWSFFSIIHRYLMNPANSEQYGLNGSRFADAAMCCLTYLWDKFPARTRSQHCTEYIRLIQEQSDAMELEFYDGPGLSRKKYSIAVEYFAYFLQRASPSKQLIDCCRHATFSKLSLELPYEGQKANKAVFEYLERSDSVKHL